MPRPLLSRRFLPWIALAAALGLAAGCGSLGYYAQAVRGGLGIACQRRPIARLVADPRVDPALRARLRAVQAMRAFAVEELALPDNASYRSYVALDRPYATWTVVAAPELSLAPREWCFPVAGCVTYRGYFRQAAAERFAAGLAAEGLDVEVGGVAAFSTLGWLADPVLDTFVDWPEADLAGLLFHELAHQVVYVGDDTPFNESFASAVEDVAVERWMLAPGKADGGKADGGKAGELADWRLGQAREAELGRLFADARAALATAFAAARPDDWKRQRKAEIYAELRQRYHDLATAWGSARYDGWFDGRLNNARLASFGAYHELVPAFATLLAQEGGELPRFYAAVRRLARLPAAERRLRLADLARLAAPAR